jgi:hypothetical protein
MVRLLKAGSMFSSLYLIILAIFFSPKNDCDINKEEGQLPSVHHTIRRLVCLSQPDVHSQKVVVLFYNHFCVVYWPGDFTDHFIMFAILFMNLLIPPMN